MPDTLHFVAVVVAEAIVAGLAAFPIAVGIVWARARLQKRR
ncbi:hypothetical protein EV580_1357 [Mycobacterium sp. BK086]|nr:hypothetical protein [Mycobacterium sp. BK086]TDO18173.1 hypothetical protein EV580_1357 [Mycobacterium sp. BK086]